MADKKISALTGATTPLAGTEVLPIVQGGATVKVAVSDLTAGRAVSATSLTATGLTAERVPYAGGGGLLTDSANLTFDGTNLKFNSGYGSGATAYGCRAWVNFGYVSSAITIRASGNISSVTRASTGNYFVNFSTAMPDANYAVIATGSVSDGVTGSIFPNGANQGSSACQINSAAGLDVTYCQLAVFR